MLTKQVFVHNWRSTHKARREQMKEAAAQGVAKLVQTIQDGWYYEVPADFVMAPTRSVAPFRNQTTGEPQ